MLSVCSDGVGVGDELTDEELDREGSTEATGAFCGVRISRCGLLIKVCASFFSRDFVGCRRVGAMFSGRRPKVPVSLVPWLTGAVSCWADTEGIG